MVNIEGMTTEQVAEIEALQTKATELEEKNTTLWDKIYNLKKENKSDKVKIETPAWLTREEIINLNKEIAFEAANPELVNSEDFKAYTSKWYGLDDAKILVEAKDPTIAARQNTNNANFTSWSPSNTTGAYTMEQLAEIGKVNPSKYTELLKDYKAGKITVK